MFAVCHCLRIKHGYEVSNARKKSGDSKSQSLWRMSGYLVKWARLFRRFADFVSHWKSFNSCVYLPFCSVYPCIPSFSFLRSYILLSLALHLPVLSAFFSHHALSPPFTLLHLMSFNIYCPLSDTGSNCFVRKFCVWNTSILSVRSTSTN